MNWFFRAPSCREPDDLRRDRAEVVIPGLIDGRVEELLSEGTMAWLELSSARRDRAGQRLDELSATRGVFPGFGPY